MDREWLIKTIAEAIIWFVVTLVMTHLINLL